MNLLNSIDGADEPAGNGGDAAAGTAPPPPAAPKRVYRDKVNCFLARYKEEINKDDKNQAKRIDACWDEYKETQAAAVAKHAEELKKWAEDWPEAAKKLEEARSAAEAKEKARKAKEASKEERAPKKPKSAPASSDVDVVANELEEMKDLFVEAVVALGKIGDMMRANGKA